MTLLVSRGRFLKKSALVGGAAVAAGSLSELGQGGYTEASDSRANTTLTVMYNKGEFSDQQVKAFQAAYPGVTVRRMEFNQVALTAMLSAGKPPDVVRSTGLGIAGQIGRGLLMNLDAQLKMSKTLAPANLLPVNDLYRWNGKTQGLGPRYGVVKDWSQDGTLWYNKKILDAAKVPHPTAETPWTYDQLLSVGKKLTVRKGGHTLIYGLDMPSWGVPGFILQGMLQLNTPLFTPDLTKADFTTAAALKCLKWVVDYCQARVGSSWINPATDLNFYSGNVGLEVMGYWYHGNIVANNPKLLPYAAFAPAPQIGATRVSSCQAGTGGYISAATKYPELSWKFYEWFFGGQPAIDRATSGWGYPAVKSLFTDLPHNSIFDQATNKAVQADLPYQRVLTLSPYIDLNGFGLALQKFLTPVINNQGNLNDAARALTVNVNKTLRIGKDAIG